jgi:hypothetical protein
MAGNIGNMTRGQLRLFIDEVRGSRPTGEILGYTMLDNDGASGNAQYILTTSYVVPTSNWKIVFTAPLSGKVEIQFSCLLWTTATGYVYLGLSDNASYSVLHAKHERQVAEPDEDDDATIFHSWYLTGLTAGTTYTYYIGTKGSNTSQSWLWGGTSANYAAPLIIRAFSLPSTIVTDAT